MTWLPPVVTISASYGAGGSIVGPRVAEMLGVPFLDRAIPLEVARRLAVPLEDALAHDERCERRLARLLSAFAQAPVAAAGWQPVPVPDERAFKDEAERVIHEHARGGAVILGRAAALVLAEDPRALHVRLDGPTDARVAQAMRLAGLDEREARDRQRDADRARDAYVKQFYRADAHDPRLYHVVLDSTVLDLETCAGLITSATRARTASSIAA